MPEARFLKMVIIALLVLNIGTLGYLWTQHPPTHPPEDGRHGEDAARYLRRSLRLTDAQEDRYRAMRRRHHASVEAIRGRIRAQKRDLYALMRAADTSAASVKAIALTDSLAIAQKEIEWITYAHFRELRALCTPDQQRDFDEVIGAALERMR